MRFTPNGCIKERYLVVESEKLTNNLQLLGNCVKKIKVSIIRYWEVTYGLSIGTKISHLE